MRVHCSRTSLSPLASMHLRILWLLRIFLSTRQEINVNVGRQNRMRCRHEPTQQGAGYGSQKHVYLWASSWYSPLFISSMSADIPALSPCPARGEISNCASWQQEILSVGIHRKITRTPARLLEKHRFLPSKPVVEFAKVVNRIIWNRLFDSLSRPCTGIRFAVRANDSDPAGGVRYS